MELYHCPKRDDHKLETASGSIAKRKFGYTWVVFGYEWVPYDDDHDGGFTDMFICEAGWALTSKGADKRYNNALDDIVERFGHEGKSTDA